MAPRSCVVCDQPAKRPERHPLCGRPACQATFDQAATAPDPDFRRMLQWSGRALREAQAQMKVRVRLQGEREAVETREDAAAFAVLGARPDQGSGSVLQLVAPSGRAPSRPLPERRRRAYAAHLDAVIAVAFAEGPPDPGQNTTARLAPCDAASPGSLAQRLCGVCGGGCCPSAGDAAYIKRETIRRAMADHPGLGPAELRDLYLGHLPSRTVWGSCVNHTRQGCSLPRSLRSDTCNTYACDSLARLQSGLAADPPVRRVVVLNRRQNCCDREDLRLDNDIVGAALLTEKATIRLRPPRPGRPD